MIQELLGGSSASVLAGERNISLPSSPVGTSPASEKPNQTQTQNQNLRCPRCDSGNTKFCYYNNYNLTQPRHFCKTCRRYWTKGGALRNVPIGGGCRRSKNVTITSHSVKPNTGVRLKNTLSCEIGKLGFEGYNGNNHDQLFASNPILWAPSQGAHIMSLLKSNQNQSPNPNPNINPNPRCVGMKEESIMSTTQALGLGQFNPFWRSNQGQGEQSGFVIGHESHSNAGIGQDLYQRLRSTGNYYQDNHHHPMTMSSGVATSSAPCNVLELAPIGSGAVSSDLGYWSPTVNWSDLPTTNGAYP